MLRLLITGMTFTFAGYNFDILESFQSYIHNLAENMGINVEGAWATPARTYQVTTFK